MSHENSLPEYTQQEIAEWQYEARRLRLNNPSDPFKREESEIPFEQVPSYHKFRRNKEGQIVGMIDLGDIVAPVYPSYLDGLPKIAWQVQYGSLGGLKLVATEAALAKAIEDRMETRFSCVGQYLRIKPSL
jgi:hypothetical protein